MDFDGIQKTICFAIMLEKKKKNEAQKRFPKKHVIGIDLGCQRGRPGAKTDSRICNIRIKNQCLNHEKAWKTKPGGSKNASKADKMRFEMLWAGSWEWVSFWNAKHGARLFDTFQFFIEQIVILIPFWEPGGSRRGPKISFSWLSCWKMSKNEVQEWFQKKHVIWIDFGCQKGRPWEAKMLFLRGTLVKNEDLGIPKFHEKCMAKCYQKAMKFGASSAQGWNFHDFFKFSKMLDF